MISVKCKITNNPDLSEYFRQYGSVLRFSYNRLFKDKKDPLETYHLTKTLNNTKLLDASFKEFAVQEAKQIISSQEERSQKKIIFGGKKGFWDLKFKKIQKSDFDKNSYFYCIGSADNKGNRKFNFDLPNGKVVFKPERGVKICIEFKVPSNYKKLLDKAQELADKKQCPISVRVNKEYIIFNVDEKIIQQQKKRSIKNRVLAIDSNPEFIGLTVSDFNGDAQTIIHREVFDLSALSDCNKNKRNHEIFAIAKSIAKLALHFKCGVVGLEKLKIKSKDHKKGKKFNRKVNNLWNRRKFLDNLKKWLNIFNIKFIEVLPQYSSLVGQINFPEETDSIAASLEIARRANLFDRIYLRKLEEKRDILFPKWTNDVLEATRWKEMFHDKSFESWKQLFAYIKESKLSYRFLFRDWKQSAVFFSFKSYTSKVFHYQKI